MQSDIETQDEAELQFEAIATLMAAGREYEPEFIESVVEASGYSMADLKCAVEEESKSRIDSLFAAIGFDDNEDIEAADDDDADDESDSPGHRLWEFSGHVPPGATACVFHDGRKLGEIKAPHGHFEI